MELTERMNEMNLASRMEFSQKNPDEKRKFREINFKQIFMSE